MVNYECLSLSVYRVRLHHGAVSRGGTVSFVPVKKENRKHGIHEQVVAMTWKRRSECIL